MWHPLSAVALLAAASLVGCAPTVDQRGNLPEAEEVAKIHVGSTTKDQVVKLLGTPSSTGVFDDRTWYYISRKTKQVSFFEPDVLDQQVYVLNFNPQGVVTSVDHKGLKDGRSIAMAPGATPAPGRELTFLEQIIGNVGRFNRPSSTKEEGDTGAPNTGGPKPYTPDR